MLEQAQKKNKNKYKSDLDEIKKTSKKSKGQNSALYNIETI